MTSWSPYSWPVQSYFIHIIVIFLFFFQRFFSPTQLKHQCYIFLFHAVARKQKVHIFLEFKSLIILKFSHKFLELTFNRRTHLDPWHSIETVTDWLEATFSLPTRHKFLKAVDKICPAKVWKWYFLATFQLKCRHLTNFLILQKLKGTKQKSWERQFNDVARRLWGSFFWFVIKLSQKTTKVNDVKKVCTLQVPDFLWKTPGAVDRVLADWFLSISCQFSQVNGHSSRVAVNKSVLNRGKFDLCPTDFGFSCALESTPSKWWSVLWNICHELVPRFRRSKLPQMKRLQKERKMTFKYL